MGAPRQALTSATPATPSSAQTSRRSTTHPNPLGALLVSMIAVDLKGIILSWNAPAEALFGWSAEEVVGRPVRGLLVPAGNTVDPGDVIRAVTAGGSWQGEVRMLRRDGEELTVHVVDSPLYNSSGTVTGIMSVAVDVTQERLASTAVLRAVIENSATSVTVVGCDDNIVLTMGDARTDRATKTAFIGRSVSDLMPGRAFLDTLARARAEGSSRDVVTFGGRTYDSTAVHLPDAVAGPGGIAFVATDITEHLAESRRYQALIENLDDVTTILSVDGVVQYASPAILAMSGYTADRFLGTTLWDVVHPDDLAELKEVFASALAQPGLAIDHVARGRHRDGSWLTLKHTVVNRLDDPAVGGVIAISRDITEYRAAKERLLALNRLHIVLDEAGFAMVRATEPLQLLAGVCRILVASGGCTDAAVTTVALDGDAVAVLAEEHQGSDQLSAEAAMAAMVAAVRASAAAGPQAGDDVSGIAGAVAPGLLLFPILRRDDSRGMLVLRLPNGSDITDEELGLLGGLVRDTAFALDALSVDRDRGEAITLATRRATQQSIASALGLLALGTATSADVIASAVASLASLGLRQVTVLERIPASDELVVVAAVGEEAGSTAGRRVPRELSPITNEVMLTGAPVTIHDIAKDERFSTCSQLLNVGSCVSVPILAGSDVVAALTVHSRTVDDFDVHDVHFYESLANVISGAIERGRHEDSVRYETMHDRLTGLPNRTLLMDRVAQALARCRRGSVGELAILALDIDSFKRININLGHEAGDQLLGLVSEQLREAVRPADTVAHLGGDEFVVLCEGLSHAGEAAVVAERVLQRMREDFVLDAGDVSITMSIGITRSAEDGNVSDLLRDADAAMFRAKEMGRNRVEVVDDALRSRLAARAELELALRDALANGEFSVAYQPKVSLLTDRVTGVEALLRWNHPKRSIPPLEFIPLAEESGLIIPIGAWVLSEVCKDARRWRDALPGGLPVNVAVNVSPRQFVPGLAASFGKIIADAGIDAGTVCLEVTESMVMQDAELTIEILRELKSLGVQISIDDFGTGLSSLAYLRRFPLDELKIDKSFIDGLGQDAEDTAIVAAIMGMAHALDLRVVAEGVELADQLARLRTLGCDTAQGYHLGRPGRSGDIDDLLLAEAATAAGRHERAPGPGQAERILLVDDAPDVRQLARSSLAAAGFEVADASTGEAALALVRTFHPDCVVLDVHLPGIGGLEVCRVLRQAPDSRDITIVMLSGDADPAERVEAFSLTADDYIVKPFTPRDLVSRVTTAMRRRQPLTPTVRS